MTEAKRTAPSPSQTAPKPRTPAKASTPIAKDEKTPEKPVEGLKFSDPPTLAEQLAYQKLIAGNQTQTNEIEKAAALQKPKPVRPPIGGPDGQVKKAT